MEPEDWPDDGSYRQPLPPEDRLWRHPSELAPVTGLAAAGPGGDRSGRSLLTVTLLAGAATSALLVTGLLAVTVGLGSRAPRDTAGARVTAVSAFATSAPQNVALPAGGDVTTGLATVAAVTPAGRRTGAAIALDANGTLVTSATLVQDAKSIHVTLDDGTRRPATLTGVDLEAGIAVLSIAVPTMRPGRLGSAAQLAPGDTVSLRDPLANRARIDAEVENLGQEVATAAGGTYKHAVTLRAPAWCVAEGAAVLDGNNRIVGLATLDAGGEVRAVPIDIARSAADSVAVSGVVRAALFGVEARTLSADEADRLGIGNGVMVKQLNTPGPALAAGIGVGDVLVTIDGEPVESVEGLVIMIRAQQPGDEVEVEYVHDGQLLTTRVVLGERPLWT